MPWHTVERTALAQALRDAGTATRRPSARAGPAGTSPPTSCSGRPARWPPRAPRSGRSTRTPSAPSTGSRTGRPTRPRTTGSSRRVEAGPPRWHPFTLGRRRRRNLLELFVHTEDVRRGAGPVPPLALAPGTPGPCGPASCARRRCCTARAGVGIVLVVPGGPRRAVRAPARRRRHRRRARRGRRDRAAHVRPRRRRARGRPRRPGRRRAPAAVDGLTAASSGAALLGGLLGGRPAQRARGLSGRRRPPPAARP